MKERTEEMKDMRDKMYSRVVLYTRILPGRHSSLETTLNVSC